MIATGSHARPDVTEVFWATVYALLAGDGSLRSTPN